MPTDVLTKDERPATPSAPTSTASDDALRDWARTHVERVRRLKAHVGAFLAAMVVLTPIWALVEWQSAGGFERWSDGDQAGDWEPWILYIAVPWGLYLVFAALKLHFDRPVTEEAIDREVRRLTARGSQGP
ncbi:MAG: 2TM domain-containing protein [Pseudomonadota bacterium]